jgi:hypothetical protein
VRNKQESSEAEQNSSAPYRANIVHIDNMHKSLSILIKYTVVKEINKLLKNQLISNVSLHTFCTAADE